MTIPRLRLNDGATIPQIGLGAASPNDEEVAHELAATIKASYRYIDTAYRHGAQPGMVTGIRERGIARDELFVTTLDTDDASSWHRGKQ